MDFEKLAEERYSVRKFSFQMVEREKLGIILRAGRISPTACNNQPQRILVIDSQEGMEKLKKCTDYTFGASIAILVCYDKTKSWIRSFDGADSGMIDASISATHMMLQAADLGLGTTWVGYFDPEMVVMEFKLPDCMVPVALLPLGYPAAGSKPNASHHRNLPPEDMVFYGNFPGVK